MNHRRPLITHCLPLFSKGLTSLLLVISQVPLNAQTVLLNLFRPRAFNPIKIINGHTIRDFDNDGWDDLWILMHHFPTGGGKIADFTKDPDGDYDKDGITNYNEMLDGTCPWPPPAKSVLTPEQLAERQRKAEELAEREKAKAEAWQKLLSETARPAFPAGSPDSDSIRHDNAEWRAKVTAERDLARLTDWRVEARLDDIARKYGIDREKQERGTLAGESAHGPIFMVPADARSARTIKADELWPNSLSIWQPTLTQSRNLTGAGIRVSIWEAGKKGLQPGILTSHLEFSNVTGRVVQVDGASPGDHATAVAGMIVGGGILEVYQNNTNLGKALRGIAYEGSLDGHDLEKFTTEITHAALDGQSFSNHSYGEAGGWRKNDSGRWEWPYPEFTEDPRLGLYSPDDEIGNASQQMDSFVSSKETHLPVWAAGNVNSGGPGEYAYYELPDGSSPRTTRDWTNGDDGYDTVMPPATAKNVLTVGAISDILYSGGGGYHYVLGPYSGTGPTDDGRIKPDVVAVGSRLSSQNTLLYSLFAPQRASVTAYYNGVTADAAGLVDLSGTSFAAPCVTGGLMLAEQRRKQLLPNAGPLLASTWRAAAIHTASNITSGVNFKDGWGIFNAAALVALLEQDHALGRGSLIKEFTVTTGVPKSFYVTVPAYKVGYMTLAWSDPAGSPPPHGSVVDPPTPMLVNDLDLTVEDTATGTVHLPWILDPDLMGKSAAVRSEPATKGADHLNNVEVVAFADSSKVRRLKITVTPFNTLRGGSQKVSLILGNVVPEPPINVAAGFTGNPANANEFAITFRSDPGAFYTIQTSTSLAPAASWSNVSTTKAETATTTLLTIRNPAEPLRFWRVRRG